MPVLSETLDALTTEGSLLETLPENAVRCVACGHRCLIREGRRGICNVRFNEGGKLRVPWGYVAALQADPIEKKPFFHFLPGEEALTFGMLGCDFHCGYCFTGDTIVVTNRGPLSLAEAFSLASRPLRQPDGEIANPRELQAVTRSGEMRPVRAVFRHPYRGAMVVIQPYYLPKLRCTPDHRVYATDNPALPPKLIPAGQLDKTHYLAIPRHYAFSSPQVIDSAALLSDKTITYRASWKLSTEARLFISAATEQGQTSRQIGSVLGVDPSYIRHVRVKLARGAANGIHTSGAISEGETLRFPNEHRPGIPLNIPLDTQMAKLLGYYCAEGSIVHSKKRPNSLVLNFSFAPGETALAEETGQLLRNCLSVNARLVQRPTTLGVSLSKASAALLFEALAGKGARVKHVPQALFDAPRAIVQSFLDAYVAGDGHRSANGKISVTTVSRSLANGVAWLALKLGYVPSLYDTPMSEDSFVEGRKVKRAPHQFTVVWYEQTAIERKAIETPDYHLIPLRSIGRENFAGDVYNMEVEEEHNYLAGFFLVSNCQNWLTSQSLRDPAASESIGYIRRVSPEQMVQLARRAGASVVVSSYNEPLITAEWAADVFRAANAAGLKCGFVSNGNVTREALEFLRPLIVGYKIDLKTMQDKRYRELGGVLQNVLDGIRLAHELGLWVEVVTLVIPGFNDSNEELMEAARFIASVSPEIPWHVTAFHPDYKMMDPQPTTAAALLRAAEIGQEAGLNYVYAGNLPGRTGEYETTYCPHCRTPLVERIGYTVVGYHLTAAGACPKCGRHIPGIWPEEPRSVKLGGWGMPRVVR